MSRWTTPIPNSITSHLLVLMVGAFKYFGCGNMTMKTLRILIKPTTVESIYIGPTYFDHQDFSVEEIYIAGLLTYAYAKLYRGVPYASKRKVIYGKVIGEK